MTGSPGVGWGGGGGGGGERIYVLTVVLLLLHASGTTYIDPELEWTADWS